jgi:ribonucleoside-diphosphate reductase alpha chain
MHGHSPFIDAAAVEAWDAWFRWRERERLHDLSIEATWRRVADALCGERGLRASRERDELFTALASWQLLLDERILESAGTAAQEWPDDRLVAMLNLPMFVRGAFSAHPQFDAAAFEAVAGLAVRALDDALLLAREARAPAPRLRIGMIGLADALLMLGLPYGAEAARRQAGVFARALAQGCLRGTARLAAERGGLPGPRQETIHRARLRGIAEPLLEEVCAHGVRHAGLTAISAQPRLALLANNVADALEPLSGANHIRHVASHGQDRAIRSSGYALTLLRRMQPFRAGATPVDTAATVPLRARLAMHDAVRPWIDEPLAFPLAQAEPVQTH